MRLVIWVFGHELLCIETGHPDPARRSLEGGSGGLFEFGFTSPDAPDVEEQVHLRSPRKR